MTATKDIDLRVIKTKESIRNTFEILIKEKTFSKITITNIIEIAKINRSTFYKYYSDKYELRELLITSSLDEFREKININLFRDECHNLLDHYKLNYF